VMILMVLILGMSCDRSHGRVTPSEVPFMNEKTAWADSVVSTLSIDQKLGQLILYRAGGLAETQKIRLYNAVISGKLGGLMVSDMPVKRYINFVDSCRLLSKVPLLVGTAEQGLLNNQFSDLVHLPDAQLLQGIAGDSLLQAIDRLSVQQARALGINWRHSTQKVSPASIYKLNQNGILNFESPQLNKLHSAPADSIATVADGLLSYRQMIKAGLSGLFLEKQFFQNASPQQLRRLITEELNFDGLMMSEWSDRRLVDQLNAGVHFFVVEQDPEVAIFTLRKALNKGQITEALIDEKLRKILLAKYWSNQRREALASSNASQLLALQASVQPFRLNRFNQERTLDKAGLEEHFTSPKWELFRHKLYENAIALVNNPRSLLPFSQTTARPFRVWELSDEPMSTFREYFYKYANYSTHRMAKMKEQLPAINFSPGATHVVLLDDYVVQARKDSVFLASLKRKPEQSQLVILNFGRPENLSHLPASAAIVQLYEKNDITENLAAQLLFGAISPRGKVPQNVAVNAAFTPTTFNPVRLKYSLPQEVGIDPARLVGIDAIAGQAIQEGVMPGCQVLVVKEGKIVYDKAFGHHTYKKDRSVSTDDLYDLASITKVSATTLALMQLYDQNKISLNSKLDEVVELPENSSLKNISIKKLLTHQSGLQVYMPVAPYLLYRDQPNRGCDSFFCANPTDTFSVQVADHFYFNKRYQEKIWQDVTHLPLFRRKRTRYSDVNFYLLQKVIEHQEAGGLDQVVHKNFYEPLGLRHMSFNPSRKFDKKRLIPTEKDVRWRQQLVQGYVHDETAALLGGVAGHAGLFGTAEELAVVFQMLLNGGSYGGRQYLSPETIRLFTERQSGASRGLGFDKPSRKNESAIAQDASSATFGHTGFTGACVWADPEEDLIFIFLSNRVHPQARNPLLNRLEVRRRMHQVVYDALDTFLQETNSSGPTLLVTEEEEELEDNFIKGD